MKQIKTIKNRLDNATDFDKAVNFALAEGWTLTKREVLQPIAQCESMQTYTMLYAELEKEIITEAERGCENCKYWDAGAHQEPCLSCCEDGVLQGWEAAE